MNNFSVNVHGDSIIVTIPGTDFSVTYERRPGCEHVVFAKTWVSPPTMTPSLAEVRSIAFGLALAKSRELGWIV